MYPALTLYRSRYIYELSELMSRMFGSPHVRCSPLTGPVLGRASPGGGRLLLPRHAQAPTLAVQQGRAQDVSIEDLPPRRAEEIAAMQEDVPDGLVPGA